jgi:hypothetical protein
VSGVTDFFLGPHQGAAGEATGAGEMQTKMVSSIRCTVKSMFKKSFIVNFSVGPRFEINRLSAD